MYVEMEIRDSQLKSLVEPQRRTMCYNNVRDRINKYAHMEGKGQRFIMSQNIINFIFVHFSDTFHIGLNDMRLEDSKYGFICYTENMIHPKIKFSM